MLALSPANQRTIRTESTETNAGLRCVTSMPRGKIDVLRASALWVKTEHHRHCSRFVLAEIRRWPWQD
jgi:hypothetical protein